MRLAWVLSACSAASAYDVEFVGTVEQTCKAKLARDPNCCVDSAREPTVRMEEHLLTPWTCEAPACFDKPRGARGTAALWVPPGADCSSPRVLMVHGGSWMYGSPTSSGYDALASKLAARSGAVVLVPDYPLVPVGNFSTILSATQQTWAWLATHGPRGCTNDLRNAPPLTVMGDSAGGGTALSFMLAPQPSDGAPRPASAVLFSPWANLRCDTPDYVNNAFRVSEEAEGRSFTGDIVFQAPPHKNQREFTKVAKDYLGSAALLDDPVASPVPNAPVQAFARAAGALYVVVGGSETLLGEGLEIGRKAAAAGVPSRVDVFAGLWHDFPMYAEGCGDAAILWQAEAAVNRAAQLIRAKPLACPTKPKRPVVNVYYSTPGEDEPWSQDTGEPWLQDCRGPMELMRARVSNALRGTVRSSVSHSPLAGEDAPILAFAVLGLVTTLVLLTKALGRMVATACASKLVVAEPRLGTPSLAEPLLALRVV